MTSRAAERFAEILDGIYRSVEDHDRWQEALRQIGDALNAPCVGGQSFDLVRRTGVAVGILEFPQSLVDAYNQYYSKTNIWMTRARGRISPGGVVVSHDLASPQELLASEYFDGFLRPLGVHHSIGAVLGIDGEISTTIFFTRPAANGLFSEEDRCFLGSLVPHLQSIHRLRSHVGALQAVKSSLSSALDALGYGILIAAPDGRISFLNEQARIITSGGDGISLGPSGLRAFFPKEDQALKRSIARAALRQPATAPAESLLRISRPSGARAYEALVQSLPDGYDPAGDRQRAALVFLHDPTSTVSPPQDRLRAAFGLTPAEARLAVRVAVGSDLDTVAEELEIGKATARTHLRRIFEKTDTHRQAQLASLLLRSLASLEPH